MSSRSALAERGVGKEEEEVEERRRGIDFDSVVSLGRCGHTYMWFSETTSKEADPKKRTSHHQLAGQLERAGNPTGLEAGGFTKPPRPFFPGSLG